MDGLRRPLRAAAAKLELEAETELDASRIAPGEVSPDPHEVRVGQAGDRVVPLRVVERVGRLGPELQAAAADRERLEEREVDVPVGRAAEGVAPGIAPGVAGLAERGRVVPLLVRASSPKPLFELAGDVGRLLAGDLLQQTVVASDGERSTPTGWRRCR